ncbi:MAG: hypothetical protein BGO68_00485 [Candidatus Amoebophilus sp. 36-38]|nr:MAG: hypothetical protein BGO68_00485 [Candidatus Amoebophilus sp. 36-38]
MISSLKDTIKNNLLAIYAQHHKRLKRRKVVQDKQANLTGIVGFLYTAELNNPHKTDAVIRTVEKIRISGKQVKVLCYVPNKHIILNKNIDFFTKENINFFGKIKKEELANFLKTRFEHLYHLDINSEPILDYVVANCSAKCKIGNLASNTSNRSYLFEVSFKGLVEPNENVKFDSLIDKMLDYTKMLHV